MKLVRTRDYEEASRVLAAGIAAVLERRPDASLLVATGNTPMRAYEILAQTVKAPRARVFQLDEYVGVPPEDPRSLYGWMLRSFVRPLSIRESSVVRLDGCTDDLEAACRRHDAEIDSAGGIDLCVLGLGLNGHVGFNEPPSPADAKTRKVRLSEESLRSNGAYYDGDVPPYALTTGMNRILAAREIFLIATGSKKREILKKALHGPEGPNLPASQLRSAKGAVTVIADFAALGESG